jgi:hypothetical protein
MMPKLGKITDSIKDTILEESRKNPGASCRVLSKLLERKLNVRVSKSSINSILKDSGLSDKVGRKRKVRNTFNVSRILPDHGRLVVAAHVPEEKSPDVPLALPVQDKKTDIPDEKPVESPRAVELPLPVEPPAPPEIAPQPVRTVVSAPQEPPSVPLADGESNRTIGGLVLLKALDYLVQGIRQFSDIIAKRSGNLERSLDQKLEAIMYQDVMNSSGRLDIDYSLLEVLIGKQMSNKEKLKEYSEELKPLCSGTYATELERARRALFREIRCFRITLTDSKTFCLDSQQHTVWSTLNIPHGFSTTEAELRRFLSPALAGSAPFVLFMAPGYDVPTKDFFHFIGSLDNSYGSFAKCTLHGSASDEVDVMQAQAVGRQCVFAIWPWQFTSYRAVEKLGEFTQFTDENTAQLMYRAPIEIELHQPELNQRIRFKGCALKTSPSEKTRLVILSYGAHAQNPAEFCTSEYLKRWPNVDEAFRDFSRKVELFTYTAHAPGNPGPLLADQVLPDGETVPFLLCYASSLAAYFRKAFLPVGQDKESQDMLRSPIFSAIATVSRRADHVTVLFEVGRAAYAKELEYACARLNERLIRIGTCFTTFHVKSA